MYFSSFSWFIDLIIFSLFDIALYCYLKYGLSMRKDYLRYE